MWEEERRRLGTDEVDVLVLEVLERRHGRAAWISDTGGARRRSAELMTRLSGDSLSERRSG